MTTHGLSIVDAVRLGVGSTRDSPQEMVRDWVKCPNVAVSGVYPFENIPVPYGCSAFYFTFDHSLVGDRK